MVPQSLDDLNTEFNYMPKRICSSSDLYKHIGSSKPDNSVSQQTYKLQHKNISIPFLPKNKRTLIYKEICPNEIFPENPSNPSLNTSSIIQEIDNVYIDNSQYPKLESNELIPGMVDLNIASLDSCTKPFSKEISTLISPTMPIQQGHIPTSRKHLSQLTEKSNGFRFSKTQKTPERP